MTIVNYDTPSIIAANKAPCKGKSFVIRLVF